MYTPAEILYKEIPEITIPSTIDGNDMLHTSGDGINSINERWLSLKIKDVVEDLTEIKVFTENSEQSRFKNTEAYKQINKILLILRSREKDSTYIQIVRVITKYLNGIQRFLAKIDIRSFGGYTILFESTMIAIVRDVEGIVGETY